MGKSCRLPSNGEEFAKSAHFFAPLKLKQHTPSISRGTVSLCAVTLVSAPSCSEAASEYAPTDSRRLGLVGLPTSATLTAIVKVQGPVAGQLIEPDSGLPVNVGPAPGSGYVITCGKHADTEQRSIVCMAPA